LEKQYFCNFAFDKDGGVTFNIIVYRLPGKNSNSRRVSQNISKLSHVFEGGKTHEFKKQSACSYEQETT